MVTLLWSLFIIIGIVVCFINGRMDILNVKIIESTKSSFDIILNLFPVLSLWLGLVNIAEKSGLLKKLSNLFKPIMRILFKEIDSNDESLSLIASNFITNLFGLSSASTPLGLKAMERLQKINPKKDTASKSMITFLVLNTTGLTLIPTTLISIRTLYKSINPTKIIVPCFLATLIATISGLIINKIAGKKYE